LILKNLLISINIACTLNIWKTTQNKTNIKEPRVQEIAKLKKSGIKLFKSEVVKKVNAAVGIQIKINLKKGTKIETFIPVFLVIIKRFNKLATLTQLPSAQTSEFIPIYFGKTIKQTNIKIEPII